MNNLEIFESEFEFSHRESVINETMGSICDCPLAKNRLKY